MPPSKNLGNAAFFAIKGLKKEIEEIKQRLDNLENDNARTHQED